MKFDLCSTHFTLKLFKQPPLQKTGKTIQDKHLKSSQTIVFHPPNHPSHPQVDSRRSWEVSKLITRNVEIAHRARTGGTTEGMAPPKPAPVAPVAPVAPAPKPAVKAVVKPEVEKGTPYKAGYFLGGKEFIN